MLIHRIADPPLTLVWDGPTDNAPSLEFGLNLNLNVSCQNSADRALILVTDVSANSTDITLEVYDTATDYSQITFSISGTPRVETTVIPFNDLINNSLANVTVFGSFAATTWTDIDAIRLISDTTNRADGTDFTIESPFVASCGTDFGDAPNEGLVASVDYPVQLNDPATTSDGGAGVHFIGGPFLGLGTNDTDAEDDGQPSVGADEDDATPTTGDENALVGGFQDRPVPITPENSTPDTPLICDGVNMLTVAGGPGNEDAARRLYCVTLEVSNPTTTDAQVAGWIDFQGAGTWYSRRSDCGGSADGIVSEFCKRSSATVYRGSVWQDTDPLTSSCTAPLNSGDPIGGGTWASGNVPAGCEGHVVLVWDYRDIAEAEFTLEDTYARFRLSSDPDTFFLNSLGDGPTPCCTAVDGEVEDYVVDAGTLPVSISAFNSRVTRSGLEVSWTTVSETENLGFHIWADTGRSFELLTDKMVPSSAGDAVGVNQYSLTLTSGAAMSAKSLAITAVDARGEEEMYGLFDAGRAYGREAATAAIPWQSLRAQMDQRLQTMGYERNGESLRRNDHRARPVAVDFAVSSEGMQSINFDQLAEAGLDLRGVDPDSIAVTLKGESVARHIVSSPGSEYIGSNRGRNAQQASAGSASEIHFWGKAPDYPDALYVSEYVYRVSVDARKALPAREIDRARWRVANETYAESILLNEDNRYAFTSVLDDPWNAVRLSTAGSGRDTYSTTFELPSRASVREAARIEVVLGGVTDYAVSPDHHVELLVNGKVVGETMFDGKIVARLTAELEPGLLKRGDNQVTVRLPGGTDAPYDLVELDTVEVSFASRLTAENDRMLIGRGQSAVAFQVGAVSKDALAYAFSGEVLLALPVDNVGRGTVVVPAALGGEASYWVSGRDALHRPALVGAVSSDTARRQSADFVVIAHPAFLPATPFDAHPLNDFVAARQDDGWTVRVVDVTEIQLRHGGGMALPEAVTNYLRDAHADGTSHVLLVGGDSYDYHDRLSLGSISHIPTLYRPTNRIGHTPSDALLADVDGDGVPDLALGRWPVRSMSDLQSVVSKTLDWSFTTSNLQSSVWVTDSDDPNVASFEAQGERMAQTLVNAGWIDSNVDRIHMNSIGHGIGAASDARDALFEALADGRSITGFVGHGSPTSWTQQSLLLPSDVGELNNDGYPTLIGTLTCYTSYFVSPFNDTVAHRFMNGYRIGADGEPVFGAPNGAVAVHGAATLSNYLQNEYFAKGVLTRQLEGATLGSAVLLTRQEAAQRGIDDLVVNWTLLGDPTLSMTDE